jgi:hypothetical protein
MFSLVHITFALICLSTCNPRNSASFWAKHFLHSSSNHSLCSLCSYQPSLSLVEILILCPYYPSSPNMYPCLKFEAATVPQTAPSLGDWMNLSMSDVSAGHLLTERTLPKFCNHHLVANITPLPWKTGHKIYFNDVPRLSRIDPSDRQFHIRSPSLFMNALMWEQLD